MDDFWYNVVIHGGLGFLVAGMGYAIYKGNDPKK